MAIEPRKPPSQFVAKLQRTLGGRAGWSGFVVQLLFVAALAWIAYEIVANARANQQARPIIAELAVVAYLRCLCRRAAQPAAAVPDPVLVSRGARRTAQSAAEHFHL